MFGLGKNKIQGKKINFKIEGMHCTGWAMNIDGELEETPGVIEATTSFAKATTTITFDPNKVNKPQLLKAIKTAGYDVLEDK